MEINLNLLAIQNPWWNEAKKFNLDFDSVIGNYAESPLRWQPDVFRGFDWKNNKILALYGARGGGKTTAIKLQIKRMIEKEKINPQDIFYYSCQNIECYEQLNELIKTFLAWRQPKRTKRVYLFIDEITMIKNWAKGVGYLKNAGRLKNTALILSGSILRRDNKARNNLDCEIRLVKSLDFAEFLELINPELKQAAKPGNFAKLRKKLDYYLDVYFLTGGFIPGINSFKKFGAVKQSVYSDYLYWLIADMAKLGRDINLLRQVLEKIIVNLGKPIGYQTIAKKTKAKTHLTIAEYLNLLESMFAVKLVYQSDSGGEPTSRKAKKIYFGDPFLFWTFYSYIYGANDYWQFGRERLHQGKIFSELVENVVFSHLVKNENLENWGAGATYLRSNIRRYDINFLTSDRMPVLIRYGNKIKGEDKAMFARAGFKKGIIISKDEIDLNNPIKIVPLVYFLLFGRFSLNL